MSDEIYKIKMELTKNEYDRLCELLNIDIHFLQPTRTEPNTFSKEIMRKMRVKIKTRNYESDNRTINWKPLPLKTLNGDDIVAYECSCCGAVADKKYQHCPKCDADMKGE